MSESGCNESSGRNADRELERYARSKRLFLALKERDKETRSSYLDQECVDDAEMRQEVEHLLRLHDQGDVQFQVPAPQSSILTANFDPGAVVGDYVIRRRIGMGGMSTVYLAEHKEHRKTVALKILHPGIVTPMTLSRFRFEGELLHRLKHPGIARIFGTGTYDERGQSVPFLVMEYVPRAQTIIEYARSKSLSIPAGVKLFSEVCDAVHHAHKNGIIHRDLKPDNILIDPSGRPKLIDFGISRAIDPGLARSTLATYFGQWLGTPRYMSPEHCSGDPEDLDVTSDVYALGVILYELLCGIPPYELEGCSLTEVAQIIRSKEPQRLCRIKRELRGNLETITLEALDKSKRHRYQSAAALSEDLRRHLAGRSIEARAPRLPTRLRNWARNRPVLAVAAGIGLFVLLALVALGVARTREILTAVELVHDLRAQGDIEGCHRELRRIPSVVDPLFFGGDSLQVGLMRTPDGDTPIARVMREFLELGQREARLLAARFVERDSLAAHEDLTRFLLFSLRQGEKLPARLFFERPDWDSDAASRSDLFRQEFLMALGPDSEPETSLHALAGLSGCGVPSDILRIVAWLEDRSPCPGRTMCEEVRLSLFCIESIIRRAVACGFREQMITLDHRDLLERCCRLFELVAECRREVDPAPLLQVFYRVALVRRAAGLDPISGMPLAFRVSGHHRLRAVHRDPAFEKTLLRSRDFGTWETGMLVAFYDDSIFARKVRRFLSELGGDGDGVLRMMGQFDDGVSTGIEFMRGEHTGFEPDADTHLGAYFKHTETSPGSIGIDRGGFAVGADFVFVDFASWEVRGTAEPIEVSARAQETRIAEDAPGEKFIRLGIPGSSTVLVDFTLPPERELTHLELHLDVQKGIRRHLPYEGQGWIDVLLDGDPIARRVQVSSGAHEYPRLVMDMAQNYGRRSHQLSIRLHASSNTTVRVYSIQILPLHWEIKAASALDSIIRFFKIARRRLSKFF